MEKMSQGSENPLVRILREESKENIVIPIGTAGGKLLQLDFAVIPHVIIAGGQGSGRTSVIMTLMAEMMMKYPASKVQFAVYDSTGANYNLFKDNDYIKLKCNGNQYPSRFEALAQWALIDAEGKADDRERQNEHLFLIVDNIHNLGVDDLYALQRVLYHGRSYNVHCIVASDPAIPKELCNWSSNTICRVAFNMSSNDGKRFIGEDRTSQLNMPGEFLLKWERIYYRCSATFLNDKEIKEANAVVKQPLYIE